MLAVSAWHLYQQVEAFRRTSSLVVLLPTVAFNLFGSELGVGGTYQPMKIAPAEALWTTCDSHCPFSLFQIAVQNDETPTQILEIPDLLSILATNHVDGNGQAQQPQCRVPEGVRAETTSPTSSSSTGPCGSGSLVFLFALVGCLAPHRPELDLVPDGSCASHPGW